AATAGFDVVVSNLQELDTGYDQETPLLLMTHDQHEKELDRLGRAQLCPREPEVRFHTAAVRVGDCLSLARLHLQAKGSLFVVVDHEDVISNDDDRHCDVPAAAKKLRHREVLAGSSEVSLLVRHAEAHARTRTRARVNSSR